MTIGLVALTYEPGTAGGIETYFLDLVRTLQEIDKTNKYIIFTRPHVKNKIKITNRKWQVVGIADSWYMKVARKLRISRLWPGLSEAGLVNQHNCAIIHFPFQVIYPHNLRGPKVLSFMDMQQEFYPEFFTKEDLTARRQAYRSSCEEADHIIAISDHTKSTLVDCYNQSPAKVSVVHLAYNAHLYGKKSIAAGPKLKLPYFYYPAASWPHKNHGRLLEAFALVLKKRPEFSLVLSGIKKRDDGIISREAQKLGIEHKVTQLGYLPYEQLPDVYRHATALVFPSLFEGFGIPLLEAMASSCPVAASNSTSIPEIAGDAAAYFDPMDVSDIADKMVRLATNPGLRNRLIRAGLKHMELFSDEKMATQTLNIYVQVGAQDA